MPKPYEELTMFTGNANPTLAHAVADYMGVPLGRADVFEFSNENIFVKLNESVREKDVFVVQSLAAPLSDRIMELLIMLDACKRASAGDRRATLR